MKTENNSENCLAGEQDKETTRVLGNQDYRTKVVTQLCREILKDIHGANYGLLVTDNHAQVRFFESISIFRVSAVIGILSIYFKYGKLVLDDSGNVEIVMKDEVF